MTDNSILPSGVKPRADQITGEIFYDVIIKINGKIVAMQTDFTNRDDACEFYYSQIDRQNITRHVHKSGKVTYVARYHYGLNKRRLKTFKTYEEGVKWRRDCRIHGVDTAGETKKGMTFKSYCTYWFENDVRVKRSPSTIVTYENNARKWIFPSIGKIPIDQIKKSNIDEMIARMINAKKSVKTCNLILAIIGRCLQYAFMNEVIQKNLMLIYPKLSEQRAENPHWEERDIKRFMKFAKDNTEYYELFMFALRSGMRKGEILGLKWDCVDFKNEQITVKRNRTQFGLAENTKSSKERIIPVVKDALNMLKNMKKIYRAKPDDFVFLDKDRKPVSYENITPLFKQYQRLAGVSRIIKFHDLRHTFASHFIQKGGSTEVLQKILGHSDLKMTQHYAHTNQKYINESKIFIEKLEF